MEVLQREFFEAESPATPSLQKRSSSKREMRPEQIDEMAATLAAMGFTDETARAALRDNDNEFNRALDCLLNVGGIPDEDMEEMKEASEPSAS